ncbi:MAG: peptidoglycan DD-metalloendopeptidase family protein [Desulfovibrio sp.]|jgi:murein DD-endopeptidase MepM/ murein hydrolase activator NlpD|nr:peptidoglycan DD-metalloendopeptidase family protein [Desulfovibrio sp.]
MKKRFFVFCLLSLLGLAAARGLSVSQDSPAPPEVEPQQQKNKPQQIGDNPQRSDSAQDEAPQQDGGAVAPKSEPQPLKEEARQPEPGAPQNASGEGKGLDKEVELRQSPPPQAEPEQKETQAVEGAGEQPTAQFAEQPAAQDEGRPAEIVVRGTMEKGDTVGKLLEENSERGAQPFVQAARRIFSLRSFRAGQPYVIVTDSASGQVKRFEYEIDARRRLVVEGAEIPVARLEAIEYMTTLTALEAVIGDNLFQAVADIGESPQLALRLADIFGAEINFIRDLQEGDSFAALVEKRWREDRPSGYGRILAARFTNKGKTFEAFLFRDGERAQFYNRKGENLRKTLLQSPLAFTRITSRFSLNRLHPILGVGRPHPGVDYAAPTGTPVKAVGEGVVTTRGWAGGYGNQIVVRHSAGLESLYSHLSGYARGIGKGSRVRQGQVIGFVGSTGLATGPHLDFRLRQGGRFINPVKAINPRGEPISSRNKKAFERTAAAETALLNGEKTLDGYTVDSLVPEHIVLTPLLPDRVEKGKKPPRRKASGAKKRRGGSN